MSLIHQLRRIQFIDFLVKKKSTGSLKVFAKKNGMSVSGLSIVLSEMKDLGFPIRYSRKLESYYYELDGEMVKCLFIPKGLGLSKTEERSILGDKRPLQNICFSEETIFREC